MPELIQIAHNNGHKVNLCPIFENWLDIGRPETLDEASKNWKEYN